MADSALKKPCPNGRAGSSPAPGTSADGERLDPQQRADVLDRARRVETDGRQHRLGVLEPRARDEPLLVERPLPRAARRARAADSTALASNPAHGATSRVRASLSANMRATLAQLSHRGGAVLTSASGNGGRASSSPASGRLNAGSPMGRYVGAPTTCPLWATTSKRPCRASSIHGSTTSRSRRARRRAGRRRVSHAPPVDDRAPFAERRDVPRVAEGAQRARIEPAAVVQPESQSLSGRCPPVAREPPRTTATAPSRAASCATSARIGAGRFSGSTAG